MVGDAFDDMQARAEKAESLLAQSVGPGNAIVSADRLRNLERAEARVAELVAFFCPPDCLHDIDNPMDRAQAHGWLPPEGGQQLVKQVAELERERDAAKRDGKEWHELGWKLEDELRTEKARNAELTAALEYALQNHETHSPHPKGGECRCVWVRKLRNALASDGKAALELVRFLREELPLIKGAQGGFVKHLQELARRAGWGND